MALPNDSIAVTPVAGATVSTHLVSSKEYQTVAMASGDGNIDGSHNIYTYYLPSRQQALEVDEFDLWNGTSTKNIRLLSCRVVTDFVTAVTGTAFIFSLYRTSATGTGGSTVTPWKYDTAQDDINADITMRSRPTGGATTGVLIGQAKVTTEETSTRGQMFSLSCAMNSSDIISSALSEDIAGLIIPPGEGVVLYCNTSSSAGYCCFMVEVSEEDV